MLKTRERSSGVMRSAWVCVALLCVWGVACADDAEPVVEGVTTATNNATTSNTVNAGSNNASNNASTGGTTSSETINVVIRGTVRDSAGDPVDGIGISTDPISGPATSGDDGPGGYRLTINARFGAVYRVIADCGAFPCNPAPEPALITFDDRDQRTVDFNLNLACLDRELFCDGIDDDCDFEVDDDDVTNFCGGCERVNAQPGASCGVCALGLWGCSADSKVVCQSTEIIGPVPFDGEPCAEGGTLCGVWRCVDGEPTCQDPEEGCP